jgi:hypothetical protein
MAEPGLATMTARLLATCVAARPLRYRGGGCHNAPMKQLNRRRSAGMARDVLSGALLCLVASGVLSQAAVTRYAEEVAVLLAEESCDQALYQSVLEAGRVMMGFQGPVMQRIDPKGERSWQGELALVRTPDMTAAGYPWMEFRDIVKVDGRPLPNREERLSRLFLSQPEWTLQKAQAIAEESASVNIGALKRNVNTPAVPLLVLHPANQARFSFQKKGEDDIDGVKSWKITYREKRKPYLVGGNSADACASSGTFWIDPNSGEVLRAILSCGDADRSLSRITVSYEMDPRFTLRLPAEMLERAETNAGRMFVEGKCRYSNFRRFETSGRLVLPPK